MHDNRRYLTSFFPYERLISNSGQTPFLIALISIFLLILFLLIAERCRRLYQRNSKLDIETISSQRLTSEKEETI